MSDDQRHDDAHRAGYHREPVRGVTYDRGLPSRETSSGRDYPGGRSRRDAAAGYPRGPYSPPEEEPGSPQSERHVRIGRDDTIDLGGGLDEDWDRELGLRGSAGPESTRLYEREDYLEARTAPYTEPEFLPGPFVGRGPNGFDYRAERLRFLVCERLTLDPYVDAAEIAVRIDGDEVVLEGTVDSRESKRRAERIVETIESVADVHNQLKVRPRGAGGSPVMTEADQGT